MGDSYQPARSGGSVSTTRKFNWCTKTTCERDQSSDKKGHAQHALEEGVSHLVADLPPGQDRYLSLAERASIVSLPKNCVVPIFLPFFLSLSESNLDSSPCFAVDYATIITSSNASAPSLGELPFLLLTKQHLKFLNGTFNNSVAF
jgi:hypothetical protein